MTAGGHEVAKCSHVNTAEKNYSLDAIPMHGRPRNRIWVPFLIVAENTWNAEFRYEEMLHMTEYMLSKYLETVFLTTRKMGASGEKRYKN